MAANIEPGESKPGPPAKGGKEQVEWQLMKARVLDLRRQNMTHAAIGAEVGLERSTVTKMLKRIFRELLEENGAEEVRARELERIESIIQRLEDVLVPSDPAVLPSLKAIDSYIKLMDKKALLSGAYAPKQLDLTVKQDDEDGDVMSEANRIADVTERFMTLADRLLEAGLGSGRVVENEDDIEDAVVVDDMESDEMMPPLGEWVNGKFHPNRDEIRMLPSPAEPPPPDDPDAAA